MTIRIGACLAGALLAGALGAAGEDGSPPSPFATETKARSERPARVVLSTGARLGEAMVEARSDLQVLVFPKGGNQRIELPFADVVRLEQSVAEEGMQREWRWKEGGTNEKLYTGRTYPWRSYSVTLTIRDGRVLKGRVTAGFPLLISWKRPRARTEAERAKEEQLLKRLNENIGSTMTSAQRADLQRRIREMQSRAAEAAAEPEQRTFIIHAKGKGKPGQTLDDLLYVREIDFRKGADADPKTKQVGGEDASSPPRSDAAGGRDRASRPHP